MSLLSKVEGRGEWIFWCPGCECCHYVNAAWTRTGTDDAPTIRPSILVRGHEAGEDTRCHIFVTGGQIQFLGDCTHELAGQTVPMVSLDVV
jgi:hypothetical protein